MAKERIEYIDIAKCIGISLVFLGHVVNEHTVTKQVVYAFHMPLFFLLSGLLVMPIKYDRTNVKGYLAKKGKGLLVPYILVALLYSSFSLKNIPLLLYGTRETLQMAKSLTSLWFIPVLFIGFLIIQFFFYISNKLKLSSRIVFFIGVLFLFTLGFIMPHYKRFGDPWAFDVSLIATAFMIIGSFSKTIGDYLLRHSAWFSIILFLLSILLFLLFFGKNSTEKGYMLMANAVYGAPFYFIINALSGSFSVLFLSVLISKIHVNLNILLFVGQNTLGLFLFHKPFIGVLRKITTYLGFDYNALLPSLVLTIALIFISSLVVTLLTHFFPEIIGKKRISNNN